MYFFRMLQNEHIKIYHKSGTWIMVGLMIFILLTFALVSKFILNEGETVAWERQAQAEITQIEERLNNGVALKVERDYLEQELAVLEYRLAENLPPLEPDSLWGFMADTTNLTGIASLFTIVIAASIVANEFSSGTIKLLLIRPVSRGKILLSKYLTIISFAFVMLALMFGLSLILGFLLFGVTEETYAFLTYSNGQVVEQSMISYILSLFGYKSIEIVMISTLAFMISTVFRSSALAIGFSLFLMFTGPQFVQLLSSYDWVKYILFANTNLMQYINGVPMVEGMTMSFSITVLVLYFLLFIVVSWSVFKWRDVAV
ncbi:hypothetical protein GCM10010954_11840 [Halobacillus andaensis]|uniref:ABC transporter permease n=1 Tax=Halobacillus andaensis TaxID=1176239 RepID=A0A917B1K1_HALAA|nr:ABC transporter permease subunit [Halobacillus andaensis]MBP2003981.1 ABC-2 type transport system permease protein [Halobacillus andaensis]GGF14875.1 hypothetical protein GCM10010954_11840 [Halobacillus andaensis]